MEQRDRIIELYDIYGDLLTEKQKSYFEDYYFSDLSISEIASNYNISRNGVHDQLKRVVNSLNEYEKLLRLKAKFDNINELKIDDRIKSTIMSILKE
ncbi:MAG: hypothetical protein IKP77_00730 [Acholeplasmatales bacterium]|nr:hypothetical protein [Acholeplasmatales bacterium]